MSIKKCANLTEFVILCTILYLSCATNISVNTDSLHFAKASAKKHQIIIIIIIIIITNYLSYEYGQKNKCPYL